MKLSWLKSNTNTFKRFDRIELLTVNSYDDAIKEHQNDRSMMDCHLVNIKEQNLHSLEDYLSAAKMITDIKSLIEYIRLYVIPVIADFPGQLFLRKAITMYSKNQPSSLDGIQNFIPILGPLHVSLNAREDVVLLYNGFFSKIVLYSFWKK